MTSALQLSAAAMAGVLCVISQPATAQSAPWPTKPIRMTVSSGAGGGLDLVSRTIAAPLSEALGQNVVVDNRAGASGSIAAEVTAQAAPDGYTLMMLSASLVVYGVVNNTRYDLYRDFDAVSQIAASPYILTVYPGLARAVREGSDRLREGEPRQAQFRLHGAGVARPSRRRAVRDADRDAARAHSLQRRRRRAARHAVRPHADELPERRVRHGPGANAEAESAGGSESRRARSSLRSCRR